MRLLCRCVTVHFAARVSRIDTKSLLPDLVTPLLQAGWESPADLSEDNVERDGPAYGYAWTVGSVTGAETLVQTRPVVRSDLASFTKDFLRTSSTTALGMITRRSGPLDKPGEVARFHRWVGVARGGALAPASDAARADFEARFAPQLPDFLQRARSSSSASEWALLLVIGELHARERLSSVPARPEEIRGAVARTLEKLERANGGETDLLISDGATVAGSLSCHHLVHAVEASVDPPPSCVVLTTDSSAVSRLPDEGFLLRTAPQHSVWSIHTDDPACLEASA